MKIYFEAPKGREQSHALQLVIDTEQKTVTKGYCLGGWNERIHLKSKKDLHELNEKYIEAGFKHIDD